MKCASELFKAFPLFAYGIAADCLKVCELLQLLSINLMSFLFEKKKRLPVLSYIAQPDVHDYDYYNNN